MKKANILLLAIAILYYSSIIPVQAITFSDDGTIQDGDYYSEVYIYDTPPETTEVTMTGGEVEMIDISTESTLYMSGGTIDILWMREESTVELSGGNVRVILMTDQSTLNMNDGYVEGIGGDFLENGDNPTINISGGQCQDVLLRGNSQFYMNGGLIDFLHPGSGQPASIAGGQVNVLFSTNEPGVVNVSGGIILDAGVFTTASLGNTLNVSDGYVRGIRQVHNSIVTISGGDVDPLIDMMENSTLNVDGAELQTVVAYDNSIINVDGDPVALIPHSGYTPQIMELIVYDNSTININGGVIHLLNTSGYPGPADTIAPSSEVHLSEGLIEEAHIRESFLEISGGEIWQLLIVDFTVANITGGGFHSIYVSQGSEVNFFGGWGAENHECFSLIVEEWHENVYIHGYSFDYNPLLDELRGFWLDGSPLCIELDEYSYDFVTLVRAPVADAGGPYSIYVGDTLTLDASGSTDADDDITSYMWDLDDDGSFETDAGNQAVFDVNYAYLESLGLGADNTYTILLQVTDSEEQSDVAESTLSILPPPVEVAFDIKPESCPNPLVVKGKGVLTAAIVGSEYFDVYDIDVASIRLEGVAPIRSGYEDVATPVDGDECECTTEAGDGFDDLVLKFNRADIVPGLGTVHHGDVVDLTLTGVLLTGQPIEGADCVNIVGKANPSQRAPKK